MSEIDEELERDERRRRRIEAARREKEKQKRQRRILKIAVPCTGAVILALVLIFTVTGVLRSMDGRDKNNQELTAQAKLSEDAGKEEKAGTKENTGGTKGAGAVESVGGAEDAGTQNLSYGGKGNVMDADVQNTDAASANAEASQSENPLLSDKKTAAVSSREEFKLQLSADTKQPGEDVLAGYAVMVDVETGKILAQREGMARISPASMTKILTVLVAAEHVKNLDDTFTITREITDYSYANDCSAVGFAEDETVTIRDLFYGTILPSGADAAAALAIHTAGSMEAFVELMNEKLAELGLAETSHMTNCVGLYDEEHYCTVYDMALILKAAVENDFCRNVLSAHTYTTSATEQHPEGITISNWFLRRIEDKDSKGEVLCAKTGYVLQSGNCAASYEIGNDGKGYLCVTGNSYSVWRCIYDHVAMYNLCVTD